VLVKIMPNEKDKTHRPVKLAMPNCISPTGTVRTEAGGISPSGNGATGGGRNVTFPARQYSVNGDRRSFALLRSTNGDATAHESTARGHSAGVCRFRGHRRGRNIGD
jgi:hypothetical protein